jgi:acetyltransferase-like isoleucine patch superfamily enzyme
MKVVCYLSYRLVAKHLPRHVPFFGEWFYLLRSNLSRSLFLESARVIRVGEGADFDNGSNVVMRDHAHIGPHALISGNHAKVTIGRHVMMGSFCIIIAQNHHYLEEGFAGYEGKDVIIDDYAWLGHRVTILPGVRIGKHAIIGAGAVVTKDVPDYAVAVGNPAMVKKYRNQLA